VRNASVSDEAGLVHRAVRGDAAAYEQLVLRHSQAVRAIARSFGADWEDVVQETFLRAYAGIRTLKDPERFKEWVFGIARNVCRGERKRAARAGRTPPPNADAADARIAELRDAVDRLPERYRIAIELRHFEGLSYDEIGRRTGLGRNGVNARLTRARAMLREEVRREQ